MAANQLAGEKSPYLLQHKDNPVHWMPWGEEAFEKARRENKPVFLSIGYSTCHWCHVMAHESFEDEKTAEILNRDFVSIKLDREERPDVDRLYMAFVQATKGGGGWPMSVWLTPEGKPFFGGTYFPPEDRYGRMGFPTLLERIARAWRENPEQLKKEGGRFFEAISDTAGTGSSGTVDAEAIEEAFGQLSRSFDPEYGGFGGAPKFPRPVSLNLLLRLTASEEERVAKRALEMVDGTLNGMASGGIWDHLGGGFHRYAVDETWHVPHFEKMLYDQGQLVSALVEAWRVTGDPAFERLARETLEYVLRELTDPDGGFYSAEDADSLDAEGRKREGAFYVWTRKQIVSELGEADARIFNRHFGVEQDGNVAEASDPHGELKGTNVLTARQSVEVTAKLLGIEPDDVRASLERSRKKLFEVRNRRPHPHLDDKVLTAWNGLMISGFAKAGAAFREPRYLEAAKHAADFIEREMTDEKGGLLRTWRDTPSDIPAFAEDYAFLVQGLLDLYEATLEQKYLDRAVRLQNEMDEAFWDADNGGYFSSRAGDPLVLVRLKEDHDGAEPSANSVAAMNLLRLGRTLHLPEFESRAEQIFKAFAATLDRMPSSLPQMLCAVEFSQSPPAQIVLTDGKGREDLLAFVSGQHLPGAVILGAAAQPELGMKPIDGKAAAYVCENFSCKAPVTSVAELKELLRK